MNEITLLREAGPEAPALTPAARSAARAALLDEIAGSRTVRGRVRRRLPGRAVSLRVGAALVAVAAAWTTAVVLTGPEAAGPQSDDIRLVDFDMPAFPLALPTAPPGTSGPVYGGDGSGGASMSYVGIESPTDSVNVTVGAEPLPVGADDVAGVVVEETVSIDGRPGRLLVVTTETEDFRVAYLDWERTAGQWVTVFGQGRYADGDLLTAIAGDLIDSPRTVPLQLHLAPAGWTLDFFKDDGRIIRLADGVDPYRGLTVHVPRPEEVLPVDRWLETVEGAVAPVEELTVQGQPAHLVATDQGGGNHGWYLQARVPGGTVFVVQAPGDLSREQVVELAEQVTYTP